jgi:hypothetical protein
VKRDQKWAWGVIRAETVHDKRRELRDPGERETASTLLRALCVAVLSIEQRVAALELHAASSLIPSELPLQDAGDGE